jgi:hypothetical protein
MSKHPHKVEITDEARAILNGKMQPPVSPSDLLKEIEQYIRRYVVLPPTAYLPMALWVIATHTVEKFDCFPYIAVVSAAKRSGKTRLAEVLETLVRQPWRGTAPSPAVLYRMLESMPTLLLDETEPLNGKNKSETTQILLAILNAGYRKGATIPRCDGHEHKPRLFPVYGPKLFAAIGRLPDTLMDRSMVIHMKRRTREQKVARFRQGRITNETRPLKESILHLAETRRGSIQRTYQELLETDLEFLNDRDADLWTPLFTICTVINPERVPDLRTCAIVLSAAKAADDEDDSYALTLLRDIRTVWPEGTDKYETSLLVEKLRTLEESPWSEHQLTARKLARILKPFEVESRKIRVGERTARGYLFYEFQDAFARYLDEISGTSGTSQ